MAEGNGRSPYRGTNLSLGAVQKIGMLRPMTQETETTAKAGAMIVPVTLFEQNCTIIWDEPTKRAVVIDPGGVVPKILAAIEQTGVTVEKIWLTHGRVVDAMRASYALPGIFAPLLIGDRWLVDGALVNPVPVSAARALGAEIVIAANLSSDIFTHSTTIYSHGAAPNPVLPEPEETAAKRRFPRLFSPEKTMKREFFGGNGRPGISSVMVDAFNIMQDRITRARLAGDPPDLLISPRGGQFGWFDFHRSEDLIAHGARAAERALDSIQEAIDVLAPAPAGHAPKADEQA